MTGNPEQRMGPPTVSCGCRKYRPGPGCREARFEGGSSEGLFPRPIQLGECVLGWIEAEVDRWIRERIAATRGVGKTIAR
jgi:hypothetical protein